MNLQKANKKSLFKKGDKVYLHMTKVEGPYEISKVTFQLISRVFMYQFVGMQIAVGECYLKKNATDKKRSLGSCVHDDEPIGIVDESMNFTYDSEGQLNGFNLSAESGYSPSGDMFPVFFRPDQTWMKWFKEYVNGRIVLDCGAGCGWLTGMLNNHFNVTTIAIEPLWRGKDIMSLNVSQMERNKPIIHAFAQPIQELGTFMKALGSKALMMFARPSHGGWVEEALDMRPEGMEAIYITLPQNLKRHDDLGKWKHHAKQIQYTGFTVDKEVIFSIK